MSQGWALRLQNLPPSPVLYLSLPSTYRWALRLLGIPVAVVLLHQHDLQPSETKKTKCFAISCIGHGILSQQWL